MKIISPVNASIYTERSYNNTCVIESTLTKAVATQKDWNKTSLQDQKIILKAFVAAFKSEA